MPDKKVQENLDKVLTSIFKQGSNNAAHIVSVKTKGSSKQQSQDKAPRKQTMAERIVKHLTTKKKQESQAFLE